MSTFLIVVVPTLVGAGGLTTAWCLLRPGQIHDAHPDRTDYQALYQSQQQRRAR